MQAGAPACSWQASKQASKPPDRSWPRSLAAIEGVADRALILEDNDLVARAHDGLLRSWGVRDVVIAATVAEGHAALDPSIGLVVADLGLPDGRGIEVVRAALALEPRPVIIVVSGNSTHQEFEEVVDAGVCFVAKPSSPQTLRAVLEQLIAERAREKRGLDEALDDTERQELDAALAASGGNISRTAEILGVSRQRVQKLMDRHGRTRGGSA